MLTWGASARTLRVLAALDWSNTRILRRPPLWGCTADVGLVRHTSECDWSAPSGTKKVTRTLNMFQLWGVAKIIRDAPAWRWILKSPRALVLERRYAELQGLPHSGWAFLKAFEGFVVHAHVLERQDGFPRTNQGWQGCPDWSEMSSEQFEIQIVSDRGRCSRPEHIFSQSISLTSSWQVAVGLLTDYTKIKAPKAYLQHL